MEEVKLDVQVRKEVGSQKVKAVRCEQYMIPGVVYGGGEKAVSVKIDRSVYEKIRRSHHGEIVFHLTVMEDGKSIGDYPAIVKEEQHDCITDKVIHVDFKHISLTEKVEVKVPLVSKGEPVGVKRDGGSLEHILWELDIICLPMDIPEEIKVDVSHLEIDQSVYLKDIVLPNGVETEHDLETIVFTVVPPRKEEEQVVVDKDAEPEVIQKEKPGKEGQADEGKSKDAAPEKKKGE